MREIKFRAWDKICSPPQMKTWKQLLAQYQLTQVFTGGDDCFELMQFTGYYDRHGNEIYEGDIVWFKTTRMETKWFISDIAWEDGAFVVKEGVDYYDRYLDIIDNIDKSEVEVIGNIFKNPELLKENNS